MTYDREAVEQLLAQATDLIHLTPTGPTREWLTLANITLRSALAEITRLEEVVALWMQTNKEGFANEKIQAAIIREQAKLAAHKQAAAASGLSEERRAEIRDLFRTPEGYVDANVAELDAAHDTLAAKLAETQQTVDDLAQVCDPSGDLRQNRDLKEQRGALAEQITELRAERDAARTEADRLREWRRIGKTLTQKVERYERELDRVAYWCEAGEASIDDKHYQGQALAAVVGKMARAALTPTPAEAGCSEEHMQRQQAEQDAEIIAGKLKEQP